MVAPPCKCVTVAKNGGRQLKGSGAPWPPLALDSILFVTVTHFLYLVIYFVQHLHTFRWRQINGSGAPPSTWNYFKHIVKRIKSIDTYRQVEKIIETM